ncbi:SipW-cognate class signal peptide [Arthrobacter alpinus]|uniref:SipW-cognate class signal peptide n=1 Tax=Arthrobacter alpinus TaxID=656366 RepID=A0A1H5KFG4_9MICC|nr:SipW-dependent-type signal peptide-containing protein [Arthrobacter alpinus]SEE63562.1 SipW-cognate class signal peptide [Arthrobacter alpinus]
MSNLGNKVRSQKTSTKVRALLAGGLVLGVGAAFTLAAWTDNEWVFGATADGTNTNPGTKTYQMQQNTWTGATGVAAWSDQPAKNGGALTFSVGATDLTPGKTVYAPMQLRAVAGSEALTATLAEGVQSAAPVSTTANSTPLYSALQYGVQTGVTEADCKVGTMTGGTTLVPAGSALTANSAVTIALDAGAPGAPGTAVDLCFAITLPTTVTDVTLQGKNTIPVWRFTSITGS